MNSLRNGGDSDEEQIENDFKDPEVGFQDKNNSEGIVSNSEVLVNLDIRGECHFARVQFASCTFGIFTITAEILARLLANFYCQYADRHMNLKMRSHERARPGNSTICYRKKNKLMSVFNVSVLLLTMNFVLTLSKKSADPDNIMTTTGQMHEKLTSIC